MNTYCNDLPWMKMKVFIPCTLLLHMANEQVRRACEPEVKIMDFSSHWPPLCSFSLTETDTFPVAVSTEKAVVGKKGGNAKQHPSDLQMQNIKVEIIHTGGLET